MKKIFILIFLLGNFIFSNEIKKENTIIKDDGFLYEKSSKIPFTGTVIEIDETDNSNRKTEYKNGKANGQDLYYVNEKLILKNYYKNGIKMSGDQYDDNGFLKFKTRRINDIVYHESFSSIPSSTYPDYTLKISDPDRHFILKKGKSKLSSEYAIDFNGNSIREERFLNISGGLTEIKKFYSNGILSKVSYSIDGSNYIGLSRNYSDKGTLWIEMIYDKEGQEDGKTVRYYPTGIIASIEEYKNGFANGPFKNFDEKGNLVIEGQWVKNKKEGTFKIYNEDGSLFAEEIYKNNELINRIEHK